MTDHFDIEHYVIATSLNDRTIYIKVTDPIHYTNYETHTDGKEISLRIELKDAYTIITNCFEGLEGYSVSILVQSGMMRLYFVASIGGFLKTEFAILLREKAMSKEVHTSVEIQRLEEKYNGKIEGLTQKCGELEDLVKNQASVIESLVEKYNSLEKYINDSLSYSEIRKDHEPAQLCVTYL
jgi:hypothetical protein